MARLVRRIRSRIRFMKALLGGIVRQYNFVQNTRNFSVYEVLGTCQYLSSNEKDIVYQ